MKGEGIGFGKAIKENHVIVDRLYGGDAPGGIIVDQFCIDLIRDDEKVMFFGQFSNFFLLFPLNHSSTWIVG